MAFTKTTATATAKATAKATMTDHNMEMGITI
jgi:hypothetical protein